MCYDTILREIGGVRTALIALGVSFVFDIVWLSIYTSVNIFFVKLFNCSPNLLQGWSGNDIEGQELQKSTLAFCVVMSYFLFFVKVVKTLLHQLNNYIQI